MYMYFDLVFFCLVYRLPQELVDICASLSVKTDAIQNLIDTMSNLNDVHTEVDTMLADIKNIIEVSLFSPNNIDLRNCMCI